MKVSEEYRALALDALRGKWKTAVLDGIIASAFGANIVSGSSSIPSRSNQDSSFSMDLFSEPNGGKLLTFLVICIVILAVVTFIVGGFVRLGYARFNLNLLDGERPAVETLFAYFPYWKTTALTRLLQTLYVLLWSLLLIVPGIMAAYSYAMTEFLLADNPDLTPSEALAQSKAMMYGNRWRLFCLQISFIGWSILANITVIGGIFLTPYVETASAAFYRELTAPASGEL